MPKCKTSKNFPFDFFLFRQNKPYTYLIPAGFHHFVAKFTNVVKKKKKNHNEMGKIPQSHLHLKFLQKLSTWAPIAG